MVDFLWAAAEQSSLFLALAKELQTLGKTALLTLILIQIFQSLQITKWHSYAKWWKNINSAISLTHLHWQVAYVMLDWPPTELEFLVVSTKLESVFFNIFNCIKVTIQYWVLLHKAGWTSSEFHSRFMVDKTKNHTNPTQFGSRSAGPLNLLFSVNSVWLKVHDQRSKRSQSYPE